MTAHLMGVSMVYRRSGLALLAVLLVVTFAVGATNARAVRRTICEVQEYDAVGLSPYVGQNVTVRGIIILPPGYLVPQHSSFYIQQDGCGVNIFTFDPLGFPAALGDSIEVTGEVEEYNGTTEVFCSDVGDIELLSSGHAVPEPLALPARDLADERYEGSLVRTAGVVTSNTGYRMDIDGLAQPYVYQGIDAVDFSAYAIGDTILVTGIIAQYDASSPYFDDYEIIPRFEEDLQIWSPPTPPFVGYSDAVEISFRRIEADYDWESNEYANVAPGSPIPPVIHTDMGEICPIFYRAPQGSHLTMEIYDLQGRVVRTLLDGTYDGFSNLPEKYGEIFPPTLGSTGWDGRDDLRRLAPIGAYICRLEATDEDGGTHVATAPIVVGTTLE